MKKNLLIIAILVIAAACVPKGKKALLTSHIEYDVAINNYGLMDPTMAHLGQESRSELQKFFLSELKSGNTLDSLGDKTTLTAVSAKIKSIDSSFTKMSDETTAKQFMQKINGIRFSEKWYYNDKTLEIEKKVLEISALCIQMDTFGTWQKVNLLFRIPMDTTANDGKGTYQLTEMVMTDAFVKNNAPNLTELYNKHMADYFDNLDQSRQKEYFDLFINKTKDKKTEVYDFYFTKISESEKNKSLQVELNDPETNKSRTYDLKASDFWRIKFAEQWNFDASKKCFLKKVYAINPAVMVVDEYDNVRGFKPIFWFVFDKKVLEISKKYAQ